jgi:hypothetical protein
MATVRAVVISIKRVPTRRHAEVVLVISVAMALHMAQAATPLPAGWWTTWPTL